MLQAFKRWMNNSLLSSQVRIIFFLSIVIFIIILIVSVTSYINSKSLLQEQLSNPQQQLLQINMNYLDKEIKETEYTSVKIAIDPNVHRYLTSNGHPSMESIQEIYKLLSTSINDSTIIKSIYIYNKSDKSFVTIPYGYISNSSNFVDSKWIEDLPELEKQMTVVKKRELPEGVSNIASEVTLFRKVMIQNEYKGIIAINFKEKELFSKINPSELTNLNSIRLILDENGQLIYSSSNYEINQQLINESLKELGNENIAGIQYKNDFLLANQLKSNVVGWKYIALVSQNHILEKSRKVGNIVFIVSLISLVIGIIVVVYMNSKVFKPVFRMKQLFHLNSNYSKSEDLQHLETVANKLLNDHVQLSKLFTMANEEASTKLLEDIYLGKMYRKEDIEQRWNRLFANWNNKGFAVAVVSIDNHFHWKRKYSEQDQILLKFALKNIIKEVITQRWKTESLELIDDKIIFIVDINNNHQEISKQFYHAIETSKRVLNFSCSIGISYMDTHLSEMRSSIFEAENKLTFRLYDGYSNVFDFSNRRETTKITIEAMDTKVRELKKTILTGNLTDSIDLFQEQVNDFMENGVHPDYFKSYLRNAFLELSELTDTNQAYSESFVDEIIHTLDWNDIGQIVTQQIKKLVEELNDTKSNKNHGLCDELVHYMHQNYHIPIGVNEISDSVGISVSMASQLFKDIKGETIYSYLTNLRMEKAEEMLTNTNATIATIAEKVGYTHENSFIRVFRKSKDITPGKYRVMLQNKKEDQNTHE